MIRRVLFIFLILPTLCQAQLIEFGGGLGSTYYTGDLTSVPKVGESHLAGTAVYRLNLSEIVSFKFAFTAGKISADDKHPKDALAENRQYAFSQNVMEFSSVFEYHFLDYRSSKKFNRIAPYAFLGFGILHINHRIPAYEDYKANQPVIPMGGGLKYLLSKRLTLTAEAGARKTFTDYLDGISDGDLAFKSNYRFGNPNDKDWFFFTGFSLTYVLYKIPCPFPYVPNKSILNKIRAR